MTGLFSGGQQPAIVAAEQVAGAVDDYRSRGILLCMWFSCMRPFQHPNGNDTPGVGMLPPIGLPDPSAGAIPVAIPPGPGHAVIEGLGTGTPISALSPAPLRSVAPIGMFAPPREVAAEDVTAPDPGTDDSPDSTGKPCATELQPTISPGLMSGEVVPPASNMLLGLAGLGMNGTTADPVRTGHSMGPDAAGLNPPVKSSVGASGIAAPPTGDIGFKVPSDDVVPAPGVAGPPTTTIWAMLGPVPSSAIVTATANTRPMNPPFGAIERVRKSPARWSDACAKHRKVASRRE
jgi:hypothetical protein